MSQVLKATVGWADATGRGYQQHLFRLANVGCWILMEVLGSDTGNLRFYYNMSLDFTTGTWIECSGSPYAFVNGPLKGGTGCHITGFYINLSGYDVLHIDYYLDDNNNPGNYLTGHIRAHFAYGSFITVTVDSETISAVGHGPDGVSVPTAIGGVALNNGRIRTVWSEGTGLSLKQGNWANIDSGTSWTPGSFPIAVSTVNPVTAGMDGVVVLPDSISSNYNIFEDGGASDPNSMTKCLGSLNNASGGGTDLGFTALAGSDPNDFGAVMRSLVNLSSAQEIHAVQRTGSNTWSHRKTPVASVTWGAGAAIPNQNSKAGAGLAMCSDNNNIWLFIIDSDGANTVRYIKFNGTSWDAAWTALETSTKTRTNISCQPYIFDTQMIGVIWTEVNGANFDIVGATLNVPASDQAANMARRFPSSALGGFQGMVMQGAGGLYG